MARTDRGHSEREDAEHLHTYLDDHAMGVLAPRSEIDPELAATVSRVHDEGRGPAAPPQLKAALWEELMQNAAYADSGSLAAPLPQTERSHASTPTYRGTAPAGTSGQWSRPTLRVRPLHWLLAAVVLLSIGGGGLVTRLNESTPPPGGENAAMMAPNPGGTPSPQPDYPEGTTFPPAADCTVPMLRISEIAAIVSAADNGVAIDVNMRDLPSAVPDMTVTQLPLDPVPAGEQVDDATAAAITEVYATYIACENAGSIRQQFWLMTFDGIARRLIPNGEPIFFDIAKLGVEPAPIREGYETPMLPFSELQLLPDGRVLAIFASNTPELGPSYVIFTQINEQWLIDDRHDPARG
jgi:hypothetical protein